MPARGLGPPRAGLAACVLLVSAIVLADLLGSREKTQYVGLLELNERSSAAMTDRTLETSFDDQYFVTTPRMECGHERYEWVNQTVFVARGRFTRTGVTYEVYRV